MAVGANAAVVLRSRGPRQNNLIVQTQGFDPRAALNAAREASEVLNEASAINDLGDITSTMPGLPLACGSVLVDDDRTRVMYRMVGQLIVMVITPTAANALAALDLLDRAVRVVTYDFKSPELSADRFAKRYQEVYMALSILMSHAGSISAGKALVDGRAALDAIMTSAVAKKKDPAGAGPDAAAPDASPGGQAPPRTFLSRKRTLAGQAAQVPIQFGFPTVLEFEGLRPLPGFEASTGPKPPAKKEVPILAQHQFDILPEQQPPPQNQESSPLDDLLGPAQPAKKDKDAGPKKGEDPFAFVEAALTPEKKDTGPAGPPPPPVPEKPMLRLVEAWRADVKGGAVVRAAQTGEVSWLPDVAATPLAVVGFGLAYTPRPGDHPRAVAGVEAALGAARGLPAVVQPGWPVGYVPAAGHSDQGGEADLTGLTALVAPSRQLLNPVILRYHVPVAGTPAEAQPVRVLLSAALRVLPSGHETGVLLGVQLQVAPALEALAAGLDLKLHVPSLYELPSRCRPVGAQMDGSRRVLRWSLYAKPGGAGAQQPAGAKDPVEPGAATLHDVCTRPTAFSAAFLVSGSHEACKRALRSAMAEVEVRGLPGTSLSGVTLRQHGFTGAAAAPAALLNSWKATVTARFP